ncbi:hypothetical protein BIW53_07760 [Pseudoalteromonas byunsanensis]|uniref:DUF4402 domain-containing protein n=2 Tax=Pseudoalteromonas byunsanensis TaxID=327939 RepID=A0A1S1N8G8_9GAMM|nr:hypothetical protein BIW53_07760 [Pseudoalteromonas byunsanensis]
MKKISTLAMALALSATANAEQFTVEVTLKKEEVPLTITQTQAMSFPELMITRATNVGAVCTSQPNQPSGRSAEDRLCTGSGTYAHFRLSGVPYADVTWTLPAQSQDQDGLRFTMNLLESSTLATHQKLTSGGILDLGNFGTITLIDHDLAMQNPGVKSFTYDIVAAYQ